MLKYFVDWLVRIDSLVETGHESAPAVTAVCTCNRLSWRQLITSTRNNGMSVDAEDVMNSVRSHSSYQNTLVMIKLYAMAQADLGKRKNSAEK